MQKRFILVNGLKKTHIFLFFFIVKMAAKYARLDRVDSFDESFQQVTLVKNFLNCYGTSVIYNQ